MKTVDRLCVAVGLGLAAWGGLVCYDVRHFAHMDASIEHESSLYITLTENNCPHAMPLLVVGLGLTAWGLTGLRRRTP